jgi:hypothetical protein
MLAALALERRLHGTVRSASADPEKAEEEMAEFTLPTGAREWNPDPS